VDGPYAGFSELGTEYVGPIEGGNFVASRATSEALQEEFCCMELEVICRSNFVSTEFFLFGIQFRIFQNIQSILSRKHLNFKQSLWGNFI
jgi:hypothetical protein